VRGATARACKTVCMAVTFVSSVEIAKSVNQSVKYKILSWNSSLLVTGLVLQ